MIDSSIEYKLGAIITTLDGINTRMEKADESRAKMYARMDLMAEREARIEGEVKSLGERVGSIEKKVDAQQTIADEVRLARDRVIFAGRLGRILWSIGKAVLAAAAGAMGYYYMFTGKTPP